MSFRTLSYFCVSSVLEPVLNFIKQNPQVIDHYQYHPRNLNFYSFEFFVGAVKTQKLTGVPFLFVLVGW